MKKSYVATVHRNIGGFLVLTIILVGVIWMCRDYYDMRRGIAEHRHEYRGFCQSMLTDHVDRSVFFIRFQQGVERDRAESALMSKIDEAMNLVTSMMAECKAHPGVWHDREAVADVLRHLTWDNGCGYYFVVDTDGKSVVHPQEVPGASVIDRQDATGKYLIREMLRIAALPEHSGFMNYQWRKSPEDGGKIGEKLACFRRIDELGWVIGTSRFLDDFAADTKDIIMRRLEKVRFMGGDGYVYVIDAKGKMLVHDFMPQLVGTNVMDLEDAEGYKFIPDLMKAARSTGAGAYIEYKWIKPSTGLPASKVVFARYLPDLQWYIASGFYLEDFTAVVHHQARVMHDSFVVKGVSLAVILVLLVLFAYYASKRVVRMTLKDFSLLSSVFASAAADAKPIVTDNLQFAEFETLAASANSMLDVRRQAEAALQAYQDSLEETIARRTADLARINRELLGEINERKRAEDALNESRDLLSSTINSLDGRLLVIDRHMRIVLCNWSFQNFLREKNLGAERKCYEIVHGTAQPCDNCLVAQTFEDGKPRVHEYYTKDGTCSEMRVTPIIRPDGSIPLVIEYTFDITERKRAEVELVRLRKLLGNIIDSMPSVLVGIDEEGRVTQWNAEAQKRTGLASDQARGKMLVDLIPELAGEMANINETVRNRNVLHSEKVARVVDGQTRFEDITVYPLKANGVQGAVIRIDDVTRRVNMEDIMIQSEKMLSVGGLAAGMAHEINNPLAGILQNIQVIDNRFRPGLVRNEEAADKCGTTMQTIESYMKLRGVFDMLAAVMESGKRAARIVENMLSFSRKSDSRFSSHDLGKLLDKTVDLAFNDYDMKKKYDFRKIRFERDYAEDLPLVPCEGATIQQVLLNILKNAAHAMAQMDRENLCIRLSVAKEGDKAVIRIADNGPGIDEKTRKRIFEPFFTTKDVGVGTGLGLSVSYFIITERHGGELMVESVPGQGTTFIIKLLLERKDGK